MQVILSKDVYGFIGNNSSRIHAHSGDKLDVILRNKTHFICDSLVHPNTAIVVFPSQCQEILIEKNIEDEHAFEKYYHVYDNPINRLNNDLFDSNEEEY